MAARPPEPSAATQAFVRAEVAEAAAEGLRLQLEGTEDEIDLLRRDRERLSALVDFQQVELAGLREKVRSLEAELHQVKLEPLVASLVRSVHDGASVLDDRTVASTHLELRVPLRVEPDGAALVAASPGTYSPDALSTIAIDVVGVPPSPADEARLRAAARVARAGELLQPALDRDFGEEARAAADAVRVRVAQLLSPRPTPSELPGRLTPLVDALVTLAQQVASLREPVERLAALVASLSVPPETEDLDRTAEALTAVAEALGAEPR